MRTHRSKWPLKNKWQNLRFKYPKPVNSYRSELSRNQSRFKSKESQKNSLTSLTGSPKGGDLTSHRMRLVHSSRPQELAAAQGVIGSSIDLKEDPKLSSV